MKALAPMAAAALALIACGSARSVDGTASTANSGALWEPYTCQPGTGYLSEECAAIAREYAAAIPAALACSAGDTCGALRPVTVSREFSDGSLVLEGLCNCPFLANGTRSAVLDAALARFIASGCEIGCCPCPPWEPAPGPCPTGGTHPNSCG